MDVLGVLFLHVPFAHQFSRCKTSVGIGKGLEFQEGSKGFLRKHSVHQLGVSWPPAASVVLVKGGKE